jgi:hypothetical protein
MPEASAHDRLAAAVRLLRRPDAVPAALGREGDGWRRACARFTPERAAFATLVLERAGPPQEIVVVGRRSCTILRLSPTSSFARPRR